MITSSFCRVQHLTRCPPRRSLPRHTHPPPHRQIQPPRRAHPHRLRHRGPPPPHHRSHHLPHPHLCIRLLLRLSCRGRRARGTSRTFSLCSLSLRRQGFQLSPSSSSPEDP